MILSHDYCLLNRLTASFDASTISPYWRRPHDRLLHLLQTRPLDLDDPELTPGVRAFGRIVPTAPHNNIKRAIWTLLDRYSPSKAVLPSANERLRKLSEAYSRLVCKELKVSHDDPEVVAHLCRLQDAYARLSDIASVVEIGPGPGYSILAHHLINPTCKVFYIVDLPGMAYIAARYLASTGLFGCLGQPRFEVLVPNQLNQIQDADLFYNAFSLYEMTPQQVEQYLGWANTHVRKAVVLYSAITGKQTDTQAHAMSLENFAELLPAFKPVATLTHWRTLYNRPYAEGRVLSRFGSVSV